MRDGSCRRSASTYEAWRRCLSMPHKEERATSRRRGLHPLCRGSLHLSKRGRRRLPPVEHDPPTDRGQSLTAILTHCRAHGSTPRRCLSTIRRSKIWVIACPPERVLPRCCVRSSPMSRSSWSRASLRLQRSSSPLATLPRKCSKATPLRLTVASCSPCAIRPILRTLLARLG